MSTTLRRPPAVPTHLQATIRGNVVRLRTAGGLSAPELSTLAGLSATAVYQIEAGHSPASLGTLAALAEALGVTVADLVSPTKPSQKTISRKI